MDWKTVWSEIAELRQKQANCEYQLTMLRADMTSLLSHINDNMAGIQRKLAALEVDSITYKPGEKFRHEGLKTFNGPELEELAFDLGVLFEDLPGQTLSQKRKELLLYFQRRGEMEKLIARCQELRPNINWGVGRSQG
jgi:hypothetical protein